MNQWWMDPVIRGVYADQAAEPPIPAHRSLNDYGSRLARMEEHQNFRAWDQRRIEQESRLRARDLAQAIMALEGRVGSIEQVALTQQQVQLRMQSLRNSVAQWLRYGTAAFLGALMLSGKASVETVKFLMGVLGFPTG